MDTISKKGLIYKYMSFNQNTLSLLINNEFWLGPPDKLNDPFEGDFLVKNINKFHNELFIRKLYKLKKKDKIDNFLYETNVNEAINSEIKFSNALYSYINSKIKEKYGVTCFSLTPTNIQMWSHYADAHKGLCLIFDENAMLNSIYSRKYNIHYKKVTYEKKLPVIEIIDKANNIDIADDDEFLFCKLNEWKKEQEVRLLLKIDYKLLTNRRVRFHRECLKGIIFGSRMEYENVRTITNYIGNSDLKKKIKYYLAEKDLSKSRIRIKDMFIGIKY